MTIGAFRLLFSTSTRAVASTIGKELRSFVACRRCRCSGHLRHRHHRRCPKIHHSRTFPHPQYLDYYFRSFSCARFEHSSGCGLNLQSAINLIQNNLINLILFTNLELPLSYAYQVWGSRGSALRKEIQEPDNEVHEHRRRRASRS